jgi:hypothetical protein
VSRQKKRTRHYSQCTAGWLLIGFAAPSKYRYNTFRLHEGRVIVSASNSQRRAPRVLRDFDVEICPLRLPVNNGSAISNISSEEVSGNSHESATIASAPLAAKRRTS